MAPLMELKKEIDEEIKVEGKVAGSQKLEGNGRAAQAGRVRRKVGPVNRN